MGLDHNQVLMCRFQKLGPKSFEHPVIKPIIFAVRASLARKKANFFFKVFIISSTFERSICRVLDFGNTCEDKPFILSRHSNTIFSFMHENL